MWRFNTTASFLAGLLAGKAWQKPWFEIPDVREVEGGRMAVV